MKQRPAQVLRPASGRRRLAALAWGWLVGAGALASQPAPAWTTNGDAGTGAQIYLQGQGADGQPLAAERAHGLIARGREAACVQCHRSSGMGGAEGNVAVPPVQGALLAAPGQAPRRQQGRVAPGLQRAQADAERRPAYTLATLQRALTQGLSASGQRLDPLMPRYALNDADVRHLAAYLDTLVLGQAPGVERSTLHLASIDTADTPPEVREATTGLLQRCLTERSPPAPATDAQPPRWVLHRWTLGSDPAQWQAELARLEQAQPVFALLSGTTGPTGRGAWQSIQRHCEQTGLPCILPHTAAVDDRLGTHWSFHFSRGVSLEASAVAQWLADNPPVPGWAAVQQVVQTSSEPARLAAERLTEHLREQGMVTITTELTAEPGGAPPRANLPLALWMDAPALQAYTRHHAPPPGAAPVFVSGELLDLDLGMLPPAWRPRVLMTYPYDPAERHLPRLALNAGPRLAALGLEPASQPALLRLQAHSATVCEMAVNALSRMGGRANREYFLELIESAEDAAIATAYPRFTLGPEQRHGSKGLWLVRWDPAHPQRLQPVSGWITPP